MTAAGVARDGEVPTWVVPRWAVVVDDRETPSGLADAIAERWDRTCVSRLEVGDVEIGEEVVVERKTVDDFAASILDGRLLNQASALARSARRPLLVVEGSTGLPATATPPTALRGAVMAAAVSSRAGPAAEGERRPTRRGLRPCPAPTRLPKGLSGINPWDFGRRRGPPCGVTRRQRVRKHASSSFLARRPPALGLGSPLLVS